ncbi:MAG: hypothetical protein PHO37_09120 [Kiritimatiellae bacterium]|nr:hypothetical protein [Kiritimatiellia bacterium]
MTTLLVILFVYLCFVFFMAVVFKAKKLKASKNNVETFCCGKCGTCEDKDQPPAP